MNRNLLQAVMASVAFSPMEEVLIDNVSSEPPKNAVSQEEMEECCATYPCRDCPLAYKCHMHWSLFGYNPEKK